MFDLHAALARVAGEEYDFDKLQELLRQIRREHMGEISPEIGVRELLTLAKQREWILEDENGRFRINVEKAA